MQYEDRAIALLNDWQQYRHLHCGAKSKFVSAIDIEIDKNEVAILARMVINTLTSEEIPDETLIDILNLFEERLHTLKDRITIELLRNGN